MARQWVSFYPAAMTQAMSRNGIRPHQNLSAERGQDICWLDEDGVDSDDDDDTEADSEIFKIKPLKNTDFIKISSDTHDLYTTETFDINFELSTSEKNRFS